MVRVYFDGILVDNPTQWEDLSVTVKTDHIAQLVTLEYEETLTFVRGAYEFLYSRIATSCSLIEVEVQMNCGQTWEPIISGVIFIGDCVFNELECFVNVRVQDDGYSARVQNNRGLPVSFVDETTKNAQPITAAAPTLITLFDPSDGIYYFPKTGFPVFECFKYLVGWMTDNHVGFQSNYFQTGDGSKSLIMSGRDLRTGSPVIATDVLQPPQIRFDELYTAFRRFHNIGMGYKRDANNNPVLVIEDIAYFRGATVILNLEDVNETELDFVQELLYAKISVGSKITNPWECDNGNTRCTAANNLLFFGFSQEEYAFTGECNKEIALDLTVPDNFVVDTSTIEDVLIYGNEAYDNSNFIIRWDYDPAPFKLAVQSDPIGTGKWWYNEYYTNKEVVSRYQDYLFGALLLYGLQYDVNLFKVESDTASGVLLPLQFPVQLNWIPLFNSTVYDTQAVFQLAPPNRFQPGNEGSYKLWAGVGWVRDGSTSTAVGLQVEGYFKLDHYNQAGVLITTYNSLIGLLFPMWTGSGTKFDEREFPWINMDENDYLLFSVEYWQNFNPAIDQAAIRFEPTTNDHYLECRESRVVVRDTIPTNGADRRIIRTTTQQFPIPWQSMKAYLSDTTKRLRMFNQRIDRTGWNDTIKYNFLTGETDVRMLND